MDRQDKKPTDDHEKKRTISGATGQFSYSPGPPTLSPVLQVQLQSVLRQFRRRYWLRAWIRFGLAVLALVSVCTPLLVLFVREGASRAIPFSLFAVGFLLSVFRFLILPLRSKVTLEQVALYLDTHFPEFENRVISAVEFGTGEHKETSDWMVKEILKETYKISLTVPFASLFQPRFGLKMGALAVLIGVCAFTLLYLFQSVWTPTPRTRTPLWNRAASWPTSFKVEPGDVRVREGSSQVILVTTDEEKAQAFLEWRLQGGDWNTETLAPSRSDRVYYHQFVSLIEDVEYRARVGRAQSELFQITVWSPPFVTAVRLQYDYPDYLEMPDREIPNGRDITVVEGTLVEFEIEVNKELESASVLLSGSGSVSLTQVSPAIWKSQMAVTENDSYRFELQDKEGNKNDYSPTYKITAQPDKAPEIKIAFPRGDGEALNIEEIPYSFAVTDDFGILDYGFQYEVVGEEPVQISLYASDETLSTGEPKKLLKREEEYLLMLEKLDLEPGDLVIWTAWATDRKPGREEFETLGDPYFLEIRPFRRSFSEAVSNEGSQRPQQNQGQRGAADQKQVIIATWNLRKRAKDLEEDEFDKLRDRIIQSQASLLEENSGASLMGPMMEGDSAAIAAAMEKALAALGEAKFSESAAPLSKALKHEQEAYHLILRQKPTNAQIRQGRMAGGGGGAGESNRPEIDELEMSRKRDFFEESSTLDSQAEAATQALNKIEELAKRQELINEDMAKLLSELEESTPEKAEEKRRRLERLEEEQKRNLEELDQLEGEVATGEMERELARETQDQIADARKQMNRSAENMRNQELQQARNAGNRALDSLSDLEEQLKGMSREAASQKMSELQNQMEEIREKEAGIGEALEELQRKSEQPGVDSLVESEERVDRLVEQKDDLSEDLRILIEEANELTQRSSVSQEMMSRKLADWLRTTSQKGIVEGIEEGKPLLRYGIWDPAVEHEKQIAGKLDQVSEELDRVAEFLIEDELDGMRKALEEIQEIMETQEGQPTLAQAGPNNQQGNRQPSETEPAQRSDEPGGGEGGERTPQSGPRSAESNQGMSRGVGAARNREGMGRRAGVPWGPRSQQDLREFFDRDAVDWIRNLRNAEGMLPRSNPAREEVRGVREDLEGMTVEYQRSKFIPKFGLFLERAKSPLEQAAQDLGAEIRNLLKDQEYRITDDGEIPSQYSKRVADYFQALAETERLR